MNHKKFTNVGIIGFGGYVPPLRLKVSEIARAHGKSGDQVIASLGVKQKAVADRDEDTASLAVAAAGRALVRSKIRADQLGAVLVGSESHPYAVKSSGSIVAEILGVGNDYLTVDLEFACKAGTSAVILIAALVEAGLIEAGLAIGADVAQSRPGDALEYTAGAGAGALILGNKKYRWLASLDYVSSLTSDTPDFWRREGEKYPAHAGRFTAGPAYFKHVIGSTEKFLLTTKTKISHYDHVVLHMPNAKFPLRAAKKLGINQSQLKAGFIVPEIGNPYSASALLGLVSVLEQAKVKQKILVTSYGSGAGSDSLSLTVKNKSLSEKKHSVRFIDYPEYLKIKGLI
ncbi:hydroxymethylglutaryl-CoA synthase [Patescibacteria group bacterium]|nr:hydroxymethylglutaryl-CoA synthase [Patescibacteria group bacterium]